MKVFFLKEEANEEFINQPNRFQSRKRIVVADDVVAIVGEFDALALSLRLRRSPFILPWKIFRDTISSCSSRARNFGSKSGAATSGISPLELRDGDELNLWNLGYRNYFAKLRLPVLTSSRKAILILLIALLGLKPGCNGTRTLL